jgi:hypothetical protein
LIGFRWPYWRYFFTAARKRDSENIDSDEESSKRQKTGEWTWRRRYP